MIVLKLTSKRYHPLPCSGANAIMRNYGSRPNMCLPVLPILETTMDFREVNKSSSLDLCSLRRSTGGRDLEVLHARPLGLAKRRGDKFDSDRLIRVWVIYTRLRATRKMIASTIVTKETPWRELYAGRSQVQVGSLACDRSRVGWQQCDLQTSGAASNREMG